MSEYKGEGIKILNLPLFTNKGNSKLRLIILIVLVISIFLVFVILKYFPFKEKESKNYTKTYQAEEGILNGVDISNENSGYTGDGYITNFNDGTDSLIIKVNTPSKGEYLIKFTYRLPSEIGQKQINISLNGKEPLPLTLLETNKFTESNGKRVVLQKGENILKISNGGGSYEIDSITVEETTSKLLGYELSNNNATKNTKKLMEFLIEINGEKILSGQQNMASINWLYENLGRKPAVAGFDFQDYTTGDVTNDQVQQAISWNNEGGIVTFSWHWIAPLGIMNQQSDKWDNGLRSGSTTFDIDYAMNHTNSQEYKLLLQDIDVIATQLKRLQDAGVPVIFRPLHEAEGGWFWWGAKGPEPAKKLYILLYNRLTNYHNINNLIWVWNSSSENWYPGNNYVDIVSYDSYPKLRDKGTMINEFENLEKLVQGKKLVAMSENGPIPDPDLIIDYQVPWSWFLTWQGYEKRDNTLEYLQYIYNNPHVITLDKFKKYNIF
ncbi:glycosyl hydrolase [Niallia sp. Man26]|uniref:glycosyl hydrolase n=1 Tax=Niallia sp. Man26 TaxID=2912824 RepID=UPI001EDB1BB4|nr:glycosyl hydrolase [Niallia sp. Man26]UPO87333.1 beta-mannanase [Niallia sp. Man26]